MMSPNPKPDPSGRSSRLALKVFLAIFSITNFIAFILAAIAAGGDWGKAEASFGDKYPWAITSTHRRDSLDYPTYKNDRLYGNHYDGKKSGIDPGYLEAPRGLPFFFLSAIAFISWIATVILIFYVFARGRRFTTSLAGYIFRVVAIIVLVFAPVFFLGWTKASGSFYLVYKACWPIGKAALVITHLNLFVGIFLALLAAVLDHPRDDTGDLLSAPPTRRPSNRVAGEA
ncbi:hypothetical protein ACJ41O_011242 [Fusarium nematophilum]